MASLGGPPSGIEMGCNIGPAHRRRRLISGFIMIQLTIIGFAILLAAGAEPWQRALIGIPLWAGLVWIGQFQQRICIYFVFAGISDPALGISSEQLQSAAYRRAVRSRTLKLIGVNFLIAVAVAALSLLVP